jgi:hypothetical protein
MLRSNCWRECAEQDYRREWAGDGWDSPGGDGAFYYESVRALQVGCVVGVFFFGDFGVVFFFPWWAGPVDVKRPSAAIFKMKSLIFAPLVFMVLPPRR